MHSGVAGVRARQRRCRARRCPRVYRQQPAGSLARLADHRRVHRASVPPGGDSAGVHASLQRGQDDRVVRASVRPPPVSQHGSGGIQERFAGVERSHAPRRALCPAPRVHHRHPEPPADDGSGHLRRAILQGDQPQANAAAAGRVDAGRARLGVLGSGHGCGAATEGHGRRVSQAAGRVHGRASGEHRGEGHPHRRHRALQRYRGLVGRSRAVPGRPQGPAHPPARYEGLGLVLAPAALRARKDRVGNGEPVLAGAVPELQGGLSFPRRKLRSGGGGSGALCRRRLPHFHSRRDRERGRDASYRRRVRARHRALRHGMTMLLQQGVTAQAQARPEATALVFKNARLSYGDLEEASNRLAHLLREAGCQRGDRVGLLMPKMPTAIVAMLGALKADAIYVPLDPASPAARQARVLEVSDCRCILAAGPVGQNIRDTLAAATLTQRPMIGWLDEDPPPDVHPVFSLRDLSACSATPPAYANTDGDVAHILFTSGSTGVPKGVMITHASVVHLLRWAAAYFGIVHTDRISQHPPLRFDVSTFDVFGTLWAGAELHLVPPELNLLPHKLAQFIRDARLTQWFSVPSVLNLMANFDVVGRDDFPFLRRVLFAGEPLPTPTLIHWMRRLPHVRFTNLYGPTETTIVSSYYTVPRCQAEEREPIPIGTACDGEELLILDSQLQPVASGEVGDLYIRGVGLSPGYWRDPEKTRSAFLPYSDGTGPQDRIYKTGDLARRGADGLYYFVGRADTQINSRGYRIELGEIEAALHSLEGLRESAVVAIQSEGFEGWLICCAYVPAPGEDVSTKSQRGIVRN